MTDAVGELTRIVDIALIEARPVIITATADECAALAARFDLVAVRSLVAQLALERQGTSISATGRLRANIIQPCAISAEDVAATIDEPLALRFVPAHVPRGEEVEVRAEDCDEIDYHGTRFDLGEAVAQSLGLAIDPFLEGPNADKARAAAGLLSPGEAGPFAALAALRKRT